LYSYGDNANVVWSKEAYEERRGVVQSRRDAEEMSARPVKVRGRRKEGGDSSRRLAFVAQDQKNDQQALAQRYQREDEKIDLMRKEMRRKVGGNK